MFPSLQGQWGHVEPQDYVLAQTLVLRLVDLMGRIAICAKLSPLVDEADRRDIIINTKVMRAALAFREYHYSNADVIHDEGMVLGLSPATQSESGVSISVSQKRFQEAYNSTVAILDLITTQVDGFSSAIAKTQQQVVNKYRPNTAFIMMWMEENHPELDDVRDAIKSAFEAFGINALRADDIEHEDMITKRILDEIAASEFLIADLTGARPSVYYEVGFAHALGKRVILYRKKDTKLHFDLAVHNCPEYENLGDLKTKLRRRLEHLTNRSPAS